MSKERNQSDDDNSFPEEIYEGLDEYEIERISDQDYPYEELTGDLPFPDNFEEEDDRHLNEQIDEENDGCTHTRPAIHDDL